MSDIAAAQGTPILAAADGVVEYAGNNEGAAAFMSKYGTMQPIQPFTGIVLC